MERAESREARSSEDGRGPAAAAASFLSSFAQDNVQQQQQPQQQRQQRRSSNDDLRLPLGRDGLRDASRVDPSKVEAAAEALADVVAGASAEAIGLRAAAMFGHTTELRTGAMQWTRGELLGEGAYGKVYAGLNQMTGELMAVKALELVGRSGSAEAAAQLADLVKELDLYKKLKHKHVVGYIDATFEARQNTLFIFLEYVPGGSIASMVNRFGRFGEELARIYTRQLLLGLEYLHSCKIVHRDVKGGNVLVTRDGIVKLADFGASKAYRDATKTDAMKSMRGSVFWMAPEVIKGTGYGRRADIWSLGCTVIEMLTGSHPWPERDNHWSAIFAIAHSTEGPPRPPGISATAEDFLDHCLQVDPSKRPTATELLQHPWVATADTARGETEGGGFGGGGGGGGPSGDGRALNHSF
ncbi:hypothetical protein MNEG_11610 [Monoraphidium neglectum]|uniref:mitogen-activated protein kinase kinase kinase n=1 Tax=Monoraphidium neglectum TaxID=145388 RepID=A0A0D2M4Z2_9CHLO|nr:hypothetical protein MNEG_11610 [Monoraphidium neglectum]KIY96351.1 hypothetical protein MNEG_11610 [Monoraphidium neglectum]|eukprot:XP_013895371.1 hypothetical protein MNEG_11610 [Monoraphidium neglectum]